MCYLLPHYILLIKNTKILLRILTRNLKTSNSKKKNSWNWTKILGQIFRLTSSQLMLSKYKAETSITKNFWSKISLCIRKT